MQVFFAEFPGMKYDDQMVPILFVLRTKTIYMALVSEFWVNKILMHEKLAQEIFKPTIWLKTEFQTITKILSS